MAQAGSGGTADASAAGRARAATGGRPAAAVGGTQALGGSAGSAGVVSIAGSAASVQPPAAGNAAGAGLQPSAAGSASPPSAGARASYLLGADVTDQEPAPAAVRAKLLESMRAHGFNAIRLRTFVDPKAADGYDREHGYGDLAHTVDFAQQIRAAGLSLTIDFHYSDNWADPGKQCVPVAWQKYATIAELASALGAYTRDAVQQLVAAGARPDMVQIGNEITPGMLLHRCDDRGLPTGDHSIQGSTKHWPDLGALLKAGADAVRQVDPTILVALHIDRGGDKTSDQQGSALALSIDWLENAQKYVQVDAFGESCYQRYQGDPSSPARSKQGWQQTFGGLAQRFPELQLFAAEYGPAQREINDVVFDLAKEQGLGTFDWAPTTQGDWNTGHDLWRRAGDDYAEQPDLELYDQMKLDYASRLDR